MVGLRWKLPKMGQNLGSGPEFVVPRSAASTRIVPFIGFRAASGTTRITPAPTTNNHMGVYP